jgi:hypothetical protein
MTINEAQAAAKRAKQARPAWLVVLTGRDARECDGDGCAQDLMRHDLVIDRETGELLYQVIQMAVQPPVRDIECNPAICPGMSPDP